MRSGRHFPPARLGATRTARARGSVPDLTAAGRRVFEHARVNHAASTSSRGNLMERPRRLGALEARGRAFAATDAREGARLSRRFRRSERAGSRPQALDLSFRRPRLKSWPSAAERAQREALEPVPSPTPCTVKLQLPPRRPGEPSCELRDTLRRPAPANQIPNARFLRQGPSNG